MKSLKECSLNAQYSIAEFISTLLCYVSSDYDPYFEVLPIVAGPSQSLFWSGTFPIMNVISNNDLGATVVSSANADSSEIINKIDDEMEESLSWCGNEIGTYAYRLHTEGNRAFGVCTCIMTPI